MGGRYNEERVVVRVQVTIKREKGWRVEKEYSCYDSGEKEGMTGKKVVGR